jgi:hypothetical protein
MNSGQAREVLHDKGGLKGCISMNGCLSNFHCMHFRFGGVDKVGTCLLYI